MKVVSLFSGGKDSTFALWCAQHQGWIISRLLTLEPASEDSWMFHFPMTKWTSLQAKALGIAHTFVKAPQGIDAELSALRELLEEAKREDGIDGLISGAIESEYQRTRLDNICEVIGIRTFAPLWRKDPIRLLAEQVALGLKIVVTACAARGLGPDWLGRVLDKRGVAELESLRGKYGVNPSFEGGEAETFVTDAPLFQGKVVFRKTRKEWKADSGYLVVEEAELADKSKPGL